MFGLVCLLCALSFVLIVLSLIYDRSARRHRKRAEMYRKQIEELQIERAIEKGEAFAFSYQHTRSVLDADKQKALIEVLAKSIEIETKGIGVNHEGECVGRFTWNKRK